MDPQDSSEDSVKRAAPAAGAMTMSVDPRAGAGFAAGTLTLPSGAELPLYRLVDQDLVLVAYKGQGRAVVNDRAIGIVPGVTLYVPRGAWHTLRNTGTGLLQLAWVSPPGLSELWREVCAAGSLSVAALEQAALRHPIEVRPGFVSPSPATQRGRRGGWGRHRRGSAPAGMSESPAVPATTDAPPSAAEPSAPEIGAAAPAAGSTAPGAPGGPRRRRHRGGRGGRGRRPSASPAAPGPQAGHASTAGSSPQPSRPSAPRPSAGRPRPSNRRRGRVKEVYMGGQWVRVEGGGSVIDLGGARRRAAKPRRDDDPPNISLSVPL